MRYLSINLSTICRLRPSNRSLASPSPHRAARTRPRSNEARGGLGIKLLKHRPWRPHTLEDRASFHVKMRVKGAGARSDSGLTPLAYPG
jgi:hypothetical protein